MYIRRYIHFGAPVVSGLLDQLAVYLVSNGLAVVSCLEDKEDLLLLCLAFGHVVTHEAHNSFSVRRGKGRGGEGRGGEERGGEGRRGKGRGGEERKGEGR